VAVMNW